MRIFVAHQFHAHSSLYPLVWMYSRSLLTSHSFCGTTIMRWPCMVGLEHDHQNYWQQYLHMEHMTGFLRKGHCLSCHASVSVSGTYVYCTTGRTEQVLSRTSLCLGGSCFPATSDRNFTRTFRMPFILLSCHAGAGADVRESSEPGGRSDHTRHSAYSPSTLLCRVARAGNFR